MIVTLLAMLPGVAVTTDFEGVAVMLFDAVIPMDIGCGPCGLEVCLTMRDEGTAPLPADSVMLPRNEDAGLCAKMGAIVPGGWEGRPNIILRDDDDGVVGAAPLAL